MGELDALVDNGGHVWDHTPAVILVLEAGGVLPGPGGWSSVGSRRSTYSNGLIDDELQRFLAR